MSRMSAALLALVLIFQVPGIVQAETPANIPLTRSFYVSMEGRTQGKILNEGPGIPKPKKIEGFWLDHSIHIPMDERTGLQTGNRVHHPLTFVKPFDAASTKIFTAFIRGERLDRVLFEFVRTDPATRKEVVYVRIELQDAIIADVRRFTQGRVLLEEVSLVYNRIRMIDPATGFTAQDDWRKQ